MLQIRKPPEWWEKLPQCPLKVWRGRKCPGRIIKLKNKLTGQTLYSCTECRCFFVGASIPTENTPCCGTYRYNNMLGVDEYSWELTEEDVKEKWDIKYYFKHVYNPRRSLHATKLITGNSDTNVCPHCQNLVKFTYQKDGRGHTYKLKEPRQNCLQLLSIPRTGQKIQYCRFCNSIYPEYRDPTNIYFYGGTLDVYLALLGIIQFCDT
jgi:hypothetical protein